MTESTDLTDVAPTTEANPLVVVVIKDGTVQHWTEPAGVDVIVADYDLMHQEAEEIAVADGYLSAQDVCNLVDKHLGGSDGVARDDDLKDAADALARETGYRDYADAKHRAGY